MPTVRLHPVHRKGLHAHRSRHLELGEAANLWSSFPKVTVYPIDGSLWLSRGHRRKRLGPGDETVTGWEHNPGLDTILLRNFLMKQKRDNPGCIGTAAEIHRPYKDGGKFGHQS